MGVAVAMGGVVAVGETTDVGVADGSGVAVAVGWGRGMGMGMESLQEAASTDTPSARGRTCLARRRRVWPTAQPPQVPSQVQAF
jgi:hypothetical protein